MNLEEAIERYTSNAEYERTHGNLQGYLEFKQLAEWLKDYKRLLEQQPCEDAISRQAAINEAFEVDTKEYGRIEVVGVDAIESLPPVNPQPCEDAISRQAALNSLIDNTHLDGYDLAEALDAIENKEKLPPVTQIPIECDDAISREDAEQMFRNIRCHLKPQDYKSAEEFNTRDLMLLNAEQMIHALPSVTQKSGRWIMSDDGLYRPICDKCGAHPWKGYIPTVEEATEVFKYCPNCGAKMESEDKE